LESDRDDDTDKELEADGVTETVEVAAAEDDEETVGVTE
jgi:hypothetical protein